MNLTMEKTRILVVEDEAIIAKNLQKQLEKQGYAVPAVAATGHDAISKAGEGNIDLVLMDIVLLGKMDGIEAGGEIRSRFNLPVIYLTAYADDSIIERAKITEPFGYMLKPFEDRELHSNIQMALYKHKMEKELREKEKWFSTILNSICDAVIATDTAGRIVYINPIAEELTGWKNNEAAGTGLSDIFNIVSEETSEKIENPVEIILSHGTPVSMSNHTVLLTKENNRISIEDSGTPIKDDEGNIIGIVLVFRDMTERNRIEKELKRRVNDLEDFYEMSIGRELKMKDLKTKIAELDGKLAEKKAGDTEN